MISPHEIKELLQKTISTRSLAQQKQKATKLEDHNLCTILGGHIGSITLLAPLFKDRSLFEFYKILLKMFEEPGLLNDISQISP